MEEELSRFLSEAKFLCKGNVTWGRGSLPLEVFYYGGEKKPPLRYVSSVRAIVFRTNSVLVVTDPGGHYYILPGGRREKGEDLQETLRRELLEETGWTLRNPRIAGFLYLHHTGIKPPDYSYPFPDIIWPVFTAEAGEFIPGARIYDKYVADSGFQPLEEVRKLPLEEGQFKLLEAALSIRMKSPGR